ncbi:hypothetical protein D3C84_617080 [compost metagenome]
MPCLAVVTEPRAQACADKEHEGVEGHCQSAHCGRRGCGDSGYQTRDADGHTRYEDDAGCQQQNDVFPAGRGAEEQAQRRNGQTGTGYPMCTPSADHLGGEQRRQKCRQCDAPCLYSADTVLFDDVAQVRIQPDVEGNERHQQQERRHVHAAQNRVTE